ncbi:hypothetical protein [Rubrivivax gelatinosus]|uniref:DUF927 domain-containing protein n=1 Tax=Rubrivivax gelatinosus (strain NBRC 100245 / IL144) TaxID=983917 RepID=I0HPN2_RUBGI|nr:hypothetical protein [Rubrivivax gelatinosus]BAL94969.1 hypothetical protein RGE_16280 [Rubrivivax gelatinosus IL144]
MSNNKILSALFGSHKAAAAPALKAVPPSPSRAELIHPGGGFDVAGYDLNGSYRVLSRKTGQLVTLSGKLDEATLLTKLGAAYCLDHYGTMDPKTRKRVFASDVLAEEIRLGCDEFGPAQAETVRGPGLYEDDGKLVVHYGLAVYDETGTPVDTTPTKQRVYVAGESLGFDDSTPSASAADVHLVESTFESFGFEQQHGAAVSLGWLASAAMGAVLPHSPSLIVTAERGSGKTTWVDLQTALLGRQAVRRDGVPTVAQVLHAVKDSSLAMICDEFEPLKVSKGEMLKLAEVFNSGFTKTPGKGKFSRVIGGKVQYFNAPAGVVLCGIHLPELEPALESRSVRLSMVPKQRAGMTKSPLLDPASGVQPGELGARLRRLLVARWQVMRDARAAVHRMLQDIGHPDRRADTWSPLLAGYIALKHDTVPPLRDLAALIAQWGLNVVPQDEHESHGEACLGAMLDRKVVVRVEADGKTAKLYTRVREALQTLVSGDADRNTLAALEKHLAMLGVRALFDRQREAWTLAVASSEHHVGARQLFQGTAWARGTWKAALLTLPGATRGQQRFAGVSVKAVLVPAPAAISNPPSVNDEDAPTPRQPAGASATARGEWVV